MKIHIEAVQFKADTKLLDRIEAKLGKLERIFDRIIDTRVYLKLENSGQVKDKITEVQLNLPGTTLNASATQKTFESGIDEVHDNLKRQLVKYKERLRQS